MHTRILFICPDINDPSGGIKQIYRQVDILNAIGYEACVVHQNHGFKPHWFNTNTPIRYHYQIHAQLNDHPTRYPQWYIDLRLRQLSKNDIEIQENDILVIPESTIQRLNEVYPSHNKVIYNQGCYQTLHRYPTLIKPENTPFKHPKVIGTLVNSDDALMYMQTVFPSHDTFKIRHHINTTQFTPKFPKKKQIVYMSRKNWSDIKLVIQINSLRGNLLNWQIKDIKNLTHQEVSKAMNESSIFLSANLDEGFGLPSIEAMASGCLVVGYPGKGGKEYFDQNFSVPVPEKDIQQFALKLEESIKKINENSDFLLKNAQKARMFIDERYNETTEKKDIKTAWEKLINKTKEV